jgi:lipid A 3-O-deacylase
MRALVSAVVVFVGMCAAGIGECDAAEAAHAGFTQVGGSERSRSIAFGYAWSLPWQQPWWGGRLASYAEVSVGHWTATGPMRGSDPHVFTRVGITPVARWYPTASEDGRWFLEAGIGAHLFAPVYRVGGRRFSSSFNFGDHVALGRVFGSTGRHEWAVRLQHFSNAGLREPNPGEDFLQLRYAVRF